MGVVVFCNCFGLGCWLVGVVSSAVFLFHVTYFLLT